MADLTDRSPRELIALAHPDDVLAVFDHDAVWVDGNAIRVVGRSDIPRGVFRIVDVVTVEQHDVPDPPRDLAAEFGFGSRLRGMLRIREGSPEDVPGPDRIDLLDGLSAKDCLERYERAQREEAIAPLTQAQRDAARELWSARLRAACSARPGEGGTP